MDIKLIVVGKIKESYLNEAIKDTQNGKILKAFIKVGD